MKLTFSFVVCEISNAWLTKSQRQSRYQSDYDKNQINIINAIYRTIWNVVQHVPAGQRPTDESVFITRSTDASHITAGKKLPHREIIQNRNHPDLEENMPKHIAHEITRNLDPNKCNTLIERLATCAYNSNIYAHIKDAIKHHASSGGLNYVLMLVIRASLDSIEESPADPEKDPFVLISQLEETYQKAKSLVQSENQQDALLIEMLQALGISLHTPALFDQHILGLQHRSHERELLLLELRRQCDHIYEMNTYAGGRAIRCTPSCDVLLTSAEIAIAELEKQIENTRIGSYEDTRLALNNADLPITKEASDVLLSLAYRYNLPEIYEIVFRKYAYFLSPEEHAATVEKVKHSFPQVYENWDLESPPAL